MISDEPCYNTNCSLGRGHAGICDWEPARDCKHGRLARSCQECEDHSIIVRLEAENDRLRGALEDIVTLTKRGEAGFTVVILDRARAALEGKP